MYTGTVHIHGRPMLRVMIFVLLSLLAGRCVAQCPGWLRGEGQPGTSDSIQCAIYWDPDGPGPRTPLLVVGGTFLSTADGPARHIAAWDGQRWSPLGTGLSDLPFALTTL